MPNSEFIHDVLGDADGMVFLNWETGGQRQEGEGPIWGLGRHPGDHSRILRRGFGIGIGFAHGGFRGPAEGAEVAEGVRRPESKPELHCAGAMPNSRAGPVPSWLGQGLRAGRVWRQGPRP